MFMLLFIRTYGALPVWKSIHEYTAVSCITIVLFIPRNWTPAPVRLPFSKSINVTPLDTACQLAKRVYVVIVVADGGGTVNVNAAMLRTIKKRKLFRNISTPFEKCPHNRGFARKRCNPSGKLR